jgi:hypothetical protein
MRFLADKHPDKKTKAWAEQRMDRLRRLFSAWHHRDELSEEGFQRFDDLKLLIPLRHISTGNGLFDLPFRKSEIVKQNSSGGLTDGRSHLH